MLFDVRVFGDFFLAHKLHEESDDTLMWCDVFERKFKKTEELLYEASSFIKIIRAASYRRGPYGSITRDDAIIELNTFEQMYKLNELFIRRMGEQLQFELVLDDYAEYNINGTIKV